MIAVIVGVVAVVGIVGYLLLSNGDDDENQFTASTRDDQETDDDTARREADERRREAEREEPVEDRAGLDEPEEEAIANDDGDVILRSSDTPEDVAAKMWTIPRCDDGVLLLVDESQDMFSSNCQDGTSDIEPTTVLDDEDGQTATVTISATWDGRERFATVTLVRDGSFWKISAWQHQDGSYWFEPSG